MTMPSRPDPAGEGASEGPASFGMAIGASRGDISAWSPRMSNTSAADDRVGLPISRQLSWDVEEEEPERRIPPKVWKLKR